MGDHYGLCAQRFVWSQILCRLHWSPLDKPITQDPPCAWIYACRKRTYAQWRCCSPCLEFCVFWKHQNDPAYTKTKVSVFRAFILEVGRSTEAYIQWKKWEGHFEAKPFTISVCFVVVLDVFYLFALMNWHNWLGIESQLSLPFFCLLDNTFLLLLLLRGQVLWRLWCFALIVPFGLGWINATAPDWAHHLHFYCPFVVRAAERPSLW